MSIDHRVLNALLRLDLASFIKRSFAIINPSMTFLNNWHIDLIADYLMLIEQGEINRLIINMPPRALKSVSVNIAWPAWILGRNPAARIIAASYSQTLSTRHSLDTKLLVTSDWYQSLFPNMRISKAHNQKNKFLTTQNGFRFATSVGGSVTGDGGDFLIVDDPHNPTHIHSKKLRNKAIDWFEQTFTTRLNDLNKGAIILVMQRLHKDDLSGYLLEQQKGLWHHLNIPAIAKRKCVYHFNSTLPNPLCRLSNRGYVMEEQEMLHPQRTDRLKLQELKLQIGNDNFAAQYLQEPVFSNCGLLKLSFLHYYEQLPEQQILILQSWDTAIKVNDSADYSVCSTWYVTEDCYYLVDILRAKLSYPELKKLTNKYITKYSPDYIIMEDKASGQSLIQDLKRDGVQNIIPQKVKSNKLVRFAATIPLFESGKILLPKTAKWLHSCIEELTLFPNSEHDDIVDSVSQAVNYLQYQLPAKTLPRVRSF